MSPLLTSPYLTGDSKIRLNSFGLSIVQIFNFQNLKPKNKKQPLKKQEMNNKKKRLFLLYFGKQ